MTGRCRLDPDDDAVWERTLAAVVAARDLRPLLVRCRTGGCVLARCAATAHGPLFTSSWPVELAAHAHVTVDGVRLSDRAARRWLEQQRQAGGVEQSGPPIEDREIHGVLALLALPPDLTQDYPDLLVRCRHGDAVLDRTEVLGWLRAGAAPKVTPSLPRREYRSQRTDLGETAVTRRSSDRRRATPDPAYHWEMARRFQARHAGPPEAPQAPTDP